jgi:hypothetical protein
MFRKPPSVVITRCVAAVVAVAVIAVAAVAPGPAASAGGSVTPPPGPKAALSSHPPAVGVNANGRLEVFAVGADDALWHIWQFAANGDWSGWDRLGGDLRGAPAVGVNANGRLEVFAVGADDALWHIWQFAANGDWSGWDRLGNGREDGLFSDSTLRAARNADGRLEVFGLEGTAPSSRSSRGQMNVLNDKWSVAPLVGGTAGDHGGSGFEWAARGVKDEMLGRGVISPSGTGLLLTHASQDSPNGWWGSWVSIGSPLEDSRRSFATSTPR